MHDRTYVPLLAGRHPQLDRLLGAWRLLHLQGTRSDHDDPDLLLRAFEPWRGNIAIVGMASQRNLELRWCGLAFARLCGETIKGSEGLPGPNGPFTPRIQDESRIVLDCGRALLFEETRRPFGSLRPCRVAKLFLPIGAERDGARILIVAAYSMDDRHRASSA